MGFLPPVICRFLRRELFLPSCSHASEGVADISMNDWLQLFIAFVGKEQGWLWELRVEGTSGSRVFFSQKSHIQYVTFSSRQLLK